MCGAGDVTAPRKRHDWDQRQPGQFFGFRPRTTTRLAPQASHVRTSMDCWPAHAIGAGATAVDGLRAPLEPFGRCLWIVCDGPQGRSR